MLIPLGPPLPDDAVAAVRGESGMLGALSVPLSWGVAVPPDDYDHWVKEPGEGSGADGIATETTAGATTARIDEWEWAQWSEGQANSAEPRFEVPRTSGVIPHSPSAG